MKKIALLLGCAAVLLVPLGVYGADYVGHDACKVCHSSIYDNYIQSGHPYKLNKVVDGQPPTYPFSEVPNTPEGYTWDDVSYVIGGYNWKARFVDLDGYIITGDAVQYNLATEGWVGYHADEAVGTKPYNCGTCHTTGWQTLEENGGVHQDDLDGMAGTFAAPGIECEGCHGPGSDHVGGPSESNIVKDTSKELCGSCHFRDSQHRIAASGGLIKHHEQYDELVNSPHRDMECGQCHDPHKSTVNELGGLTAGADCTTCHAGVEVKVAAMADHSCDSCHMPKASKSAVKTGEFEREDDTGFLGDIQSHTFKLNLDPNVQMFSDDGAFVELDAEGDAIVKVEYACAGCHNGDEAAEQTVEWMYTNAKLVHGTVTGGVAGGDYVGHDACKTCHPSIYDNYVQSGHPYKLNKVENGQPPTYPHSEVPNTPEGYTWDDVTYVIGGFGWKARFIDLNGYIITGDAVQYNLETKGWSGYHASEAPGTKPYNCGACHTTGWQTLEENGGVHQDGLEGMAGTFAAPGVECEGCHGPGGNHVGAPSKSNIGKDTSKEMCGSCHFRDSQHRVATSGGLIRHHEQYDELINSPHRFMDCGQCHDPHKSSKYALGGVTEGADCTACHSDVAVKVPAMADHDCTVCHMPKSTKSAVVTEEFGDTGILGDLHSHTFKLNTNPKAMMFSADGKLLELDAEGDAIVTADFACGGCHNGDEAPAQSLYWMFANAEIVHTGGTPVRVGGPPPGRGGMTVSAAPAGARRMRHHPNPFNSSTVISYEITDSAPVLLEIFDMTGQKVRTLVNFTQESGTYQIMWNGRDSEGRELATGMYLYRLQTGTRVEKQKMTLLR